MEAAAPRCLPVPVAVPAQRVPQAARALPLWRPWLPRPEEAPARHTDTAQRRGGSGDAAMDCKALPLVQHPVKLLWPKSKSFDYLYSVGERLLQSFPVQATLSLYHDSDSEEEEEMEGMEEEEEMEDSAEEEAAAGEAVLPAAAGAPAR